VEGRKKESCRAAYVNSREEGIAVRKGGKKKRKTLDRSRLTFWQE